MDYEGITIKGNEKFIEQTKRALDLIKEKASSYFIKTILYLKIIKSSKYSYMNLDKGEFNVGKGTAFYSIEWYASCIIHDVHHHYLHNIKKLKWNKKNAFKHEKLCIDEQIKFLKKIKAKKELIEHCKKVLNTRYWERKNRNW